MNDYFHIGQTPGCFLSFGLFRFGKKNEQVLWKGGVLERGSLTQPRLHLVQKDISKSWFERDKETGDVSPAPYKPEAYTWVKAVLYNGKHYEGGPLARMIMNGYYKGGTSTVDRIVSRSLETILITELVKD